MFDRDYPTATIGKEVRADQQRAPREPLPQALAALAEKRFRAYEESAAGAAEIAGASPRSGPGDVARVWACSDFVCQTCTRRPALLAELMASGDLARPRVPARPDGSDHRSTQRARVRAYVERLALELDEPGSEERLSKALRLARQREMVRIAWRDIGGLASLEETLLETSAFADAALQVATCRLHRLLCSSLGEPTSRDGEPQRLIVYALGKLGSEELNFSSDIDLLFAYPAGGECVGAPRALSNEEFFTRLGRKLVQALTIRTEDGIVFRVDMRLRPFGSSGPLVASFDALEDYYQSHGRDWERYALIRTRAVTGDAAESDRLLERLRPFVYRRYLDFSTLESIREMKRLLAKEATREDLANNIKLGPGGIRELEFTGQAFQMVRGGRVAALRDRRILRVIEELSRLRFLPDYAASELAGAYRFLRVAENRMQQMNDRQVHALPDDADARLVLATGAGFRSWQRFIGELDRHRSRVNAHFSQVLGFTESEPDSPEDPLEAVWRRTLAAEPAVHALAEAGFAAPEEAYRKLERFTESHPIRLLDERGRTRLDRLMPNLLRACARQHSADPTLARALGVVETIASRSVYLALLCERPLALSQLVQLCHASPWIAREIGRHPLLLDELLDPRTLYAPLDRAALVLDLRARLANVSTADTEHELAVLRQFKNANLLRVAAADVANAMPLMVVSDHLTDIAETTVQQVLELARRDLVARHGEPRCRGNGGLEQAPFAIVAYGKLGGYELGYGSDLDLVFIHGSQGEEQATSGPKVVDNAQFFARLAQRVIHFVTARTPDGILYEVDPRLRPDGSKGVLVNSLAGLAHYLHEQAWTWEHQALVRARMVAGSEALRESFAALRRDVLLRARDATQLRQAVRDMRTRMRNELARGDDQWFDLKQGPGGIADIEFMVQYAALRWARELGDYLSYTDNVRLLEGCAKTGVLAPDAVRLLTDAYRVYRARAHTQALHQASEVVAGEDLTEYREQVLGIWHDLMEVD